jgi:hypothetical protein
MSPSTTLRLDPEIRARVDTFAQDTRRSLNGAVNVLLGEALDAHDARKAKTDKQNRPANQEKANG